MKMQMDMPYVFAVVITGLVVVFLGLVLLIAFISIIGTIFKKIDKKKNSVKPEVTAPAVSKASLVSDVSVANSDEVIAVIAAAVAMLSAADGTSYRIRSVRAVSSKASAGNSWAAAGLRESTNPF